MYTAVGRRQMEMGMLRALGYNRREVMFSFIVESPMIGVAGGVLAPLMAIIVAAPTGLLDAGRFAVLFVSIDRIRGGRRANRRRNDRHSAVVCCRHGVLYGRG